MRLTARRALSLVRVHLFRHVRARGRGACAAREREVATAEDSVVVLNLPETATHSNPTRIRNQSHVPVNDERTTGALLKFYKLFGRRAAAIFVARPALFRHTGREQRTRRKAPGCAAALREARGCGVLHLQF